jgi:transmembrane sensor
MTDRAEADRKAQRIAEAVAWHTHLHESDLITTPQFEAWLADAENAFAWTQTMAVWDFVGSQGKETEAVEARVTALASVKRAISQRRIRWGRGQPALGIAAAGLIVALTLEGYSWFQRPMDFSTDIGERRIVRLQDGSRIALDSESEVTVRYSRGARELHLIKGQARFDVAHDVNRPFSVVARGQKVVATGTAFNIDLTRPKVAVTLIEGHVVVFDEKGEADAAPIVGRVHELHRTELRAGQELVAADSQMPVIKTVDVQQVTAWTIGQVIFSNETLSSVVASVNRYSVTPITIGDPSIANERVSGVFNTSDVSGFLDIVTQMLPLEVADDEPGKIVLKKKQS